jgi:uncharacterized protein (DUF362 family)
MVECAIDQSYNLRVSMQNQDSDGPDARSLPAAPFDRRKILLVGGGTTLAALAAYYEWRHGRLLPDAYATMPKMRDHRVKLGAARERLFVAHGNDPARNLRALLERFGGLTPLIDKRDTVLIKPNAAWERVAAQGATTHPELVAAVVLACREAGAKEVLVVDCPVDDAERSFERSGIAKAARAAGARVVLPSEAKYVDVQVPGKLGSWSILEPFAQATKIINLPIAKHHGSARVTAGMKNWIGITDKRRQLFHADLDGSIVALAALMRPTLTIVDASRILMRNGPRGGNLDDVKMTDALALGTDPVALDAWATDLLGAQRADVKYLKQAADRGLGQLEYRDRLVEVTTG